MTKAPDHEKPLTLDQLIAGRQYAAEIVAAQGEKYLPYFERMDRAVQERQSRETILQRAQAIAAGRNH